MPKPHESRLSLRRILRPALRRTLLGAWAVVLALGGAVGGAETAGSATASSDVARVFRFHAAAQAEALREALGRAALDEPLKADLMQLVARHLRRTDEEAGRAAAGYVADDNVPAAGAGAGTTGAVRRVRSLDDLVGLAVGLARDFNDEQVAAWLDEHPSAYQPVQEQIALAEAFQRAAAEDPDAVVRAATAAGLPASREAELRKALAAVQQRLARAADDDERRLREAEEKARAAPRAPDDRPADDPLMRHAPAAAPDSSVEAEKLRLLDHLLEVEAHARLAAAGREVRGEAEKRLTQPAQRKALEDEMLRWYQALVPPEDPSRDGGHSTPRKPTAIDPGF